MKICVVEDEEAVRISIINKINELPFPLQVFDVGYGYPALDRIEFIRPDLIFLDIHLPDIDGFEMMAHIKQTIPKTQFIILTGYDEFEYAQRALQQGAIDYLLKPVDLEQMREVTKKGIANLNRAFYAEMELLLSRLSWKFGNFNIVQLMDAGPWFDENMPKRIFFGEAPLQRSDLVFRFEVNHMPGAVVQSGVGEPDVFYSAAEWADVFEKVKTGWESQGFFHETEHEVELRMQMNCHDILKKAESLQRHIVEIIETKMNLTNNKELDKYVEDWFGQAGQLPLPMLTKVCTILLAELDEILLESKNGKFINEQELKYWTDWVDTHKTWKDLRHAMHRLIITAPIAWRELQRSKSQRQDLVQQAVKLMNELPCSELSLELIAERLQIHSVTLSRIFKKETGQNFLQVLTEKKLNQAKQMLLGTDMAVHAIASDLGYADFRYFSLLFKRKFGQTPREFRKV